MAVFNGSGLVLEYSDDNVPTNWYKIPNVISCEPSFSVEEIDVSHNSASYYKRFLPGDIDGTMTFTVRYDPTLVVAGNPTWVGSHDALYTLFNDRTTDRFWAVSPDGASPPGWTGQGIITSISTPIAHSQGVDITFTVRFSQVNVGSGQITLTVA